jgi:hypothetical protein
LDGLFRRLAFLRKYHLPEARPVADSSPLEHDPRLNDLPDGLWDLIIQCPRTSPLHRPENAREVQVRFDVFCNEELTA